MVDGFLALGTSFFLSPQHRLRNRVNSTPLGVAGGSVAHGQTPRVTAWRFVRTEDSKSSCRREWRENGGPVARRETLLCLACLPVRDSNEGLSKYWRPID